MHQREWPGVSQVGKEVSMAASHNVKVMGNEAAEMAEARFY